MERYKKNINCNICSKTFHDIPKLSQHLQSVHQIIIDEYIKENILQYEIYCPYCRKQLPLFSFIHPNLNSCKCFGGKLNPGNYSRGAEKREKVFRETILEDGRTLKEVIATEAGKKTSIVMKHKILYEGYTPKSENRFTHFEWKYKDLKFRSSWEFMFYILNEDKVHLQFEKLRLKYFDIEKNTDRTYITDFIDEERKIIYEIKPEIYFSTNLNFMSKEFDTDNWCRENNYTYCLIDERYFMMNIENIKNNTILKEFNLKNSIKSIENWVRKYTSQVDITAIEILRVYHSEFIQKTFGLA